MNYYENMMVVANEECAEVQKEISKALRFGIDNHHPDEPNITNGERILKEFHQLRAVMDMLVIHRIIPALPEEQIHQVYRDKIEAIEKWGKYSEEIGCIATEEHYGKE